MKWTLSFKFKNDCVLFCQYRNTKSENQILHHLKAGIRVIYFLSLSSMSNCKYMLIESIKNEIIEFLRPINPEKVILFGSFAYGTPDADSDIDLYVVTRDNVIPQNFEENLLVKKRVYKALDKFRKKYAADIIVHTLPVHQKFIAMGSSFSKEIMQKGVVLI